jgi:hypothetical protein
VLPRFKRVEIWDETWMSEEERLASIEREIWDRGAVVRRGGVHDRWDLEVRGGLLASVRVLMAVEEHGGGKQLIRLRAWPHVPGIAVAVIAGLVALFVAAAISGAGFAAAFLGFSSLGLLGWTIADRGVAAAAWQDAVGAAGGQAVGPSHQEDTTLSKFRWTVEQIAALQVWRAQPILHGVSPKGLGLSASTVRVRFRNLGLVRHLNKARQAEVRRSRRSNLDDPQTDTRAPVSVPGLIQRANNDTRGLGNGDFSEEEKASSQLRHIASQNERAEDPF